MLVNDPQQLDPLTGLQPIDTMGVDMDVLINEYRMATNYVKQYTYDFRELDNLVDGVPLASDSDVPFVGDTTLAGLVRSIPRQSLKQLPVMSVVVNGTKNSIPALLCTYLLKKTSFNEDTFGKGLLSTLIIAAEGALTRGYTPVLAASGMMYNDFGTTMRTLFYGDTAPEPGISDSNEASYHYVTANLTPSAVKKIYKKAMANPDTAWNVPALKQLLDSTPQPNDHSRFMSAPKQNAAGEQFGPTYKIITRYETGPLAKQVTFALNMGEAPLRVVESKSKWGYPRVMYLVIDPAPLTPFGISRVRLASPNQNILNIYTGNIASMLLINSKPPLFKRGAFNKPTNLKQGALWETTDPNGMIELKTMDNGALAQFVPMSQQFAGQIQNIMGGQTGSAPAVDKFSKVGPGVKQAQDYLDVNTNQITKILENFLRQYGLVSLDTLMCEQEGEDVIIVDDDTKNAINQVTAGAIGDDNKITINWNDMYNAIEEWSIEVDVSLSPDEMEDEKRSDIQDMMVVLGQNAQDIPGAPEMVAQLTNMLLQDQVPNLKPMAAGSAVPPTMPDPNAQQGPPVQPAQPQMMPTGQSLTPGG